MSKNKYLLKQKFSQLFSKEDYPLAMKACPKELQISERTFQRDLNGEGDDIPHIRFLQYCKFLGISDEELEAFDRDEIDIRPFKKLKEKTTPADLLDKLQIEKK